MTASTPCPSNASKNPARRSRLTDSSGIASSHAIRRVELVITERVRAIAETKEPYLAQGDIPREDIQRLIKDLESQMKTASRNLEFEKAALLRDQIVDLRKVLADDLTR